MAILMNKILTKVAQRILAIFEAKTARVTLLSSFGPIFIPTSGHTDDQALVKFSKRLLSHCHHCQCFCKISFMLHA